MTDPNTLPKVDCVLVGEDGNSFFIMGRFSGAARKAKWPKDAIDAVLKDAMSGDYSHLLGVISKYCKNAGGRSCSCDDDMDDDDADDEDSDD